jgi:hypothetical protein
MTHAVSYCIPPFPIYIQRNYGVGAALEDAAADDPGGGKIPLENEGTSYAPLGTAYPPVPTGG